MMQTSAPDTHAEHDTVLEAAQLLARLSGRPISPAELLDGVPLADGRLTLELLPRALANAGLRARLRERGVAQLTPQLVPLIVQMNDGSCAVLTRRDADGTAQIMRAGGTELVSEAEFAAQYGGRVLLARPATSEAQQETGKTANRSWLRDAVRPLRGVYVQVVAAAMLVNVLALASPLFIMNVYDRVLPNKAMTTLWVLVLGVMLAFVFDFALRSLRATLIGSAGRRADILLASRIFRHVLSVDLTQRPQQTGEFANQLRDFEFMRDFFTSSTLATLTDIAFTGLFIVVVAIVAGPLAIVPALGALIVVLIAVAQQGPLRRAIRREQAGGTKRYSLLFESVSGLDTVKAMRGEGVLQRKWEQTVSENAATTEQMRHVSSLAAHATALVQQIVSVMVVLIGAYLFSDGKLTTGAIIASVMLSSRAVGPLGSLTAMASRLQQALLAYRTIDSLMRLASETHGGGRFTDRQIQSGAIVADDVSLTYPGAAKPSVVDLTLAIRPGERVGIIGSIGSGKTTLGRMLARLYLPSDGTLLVDGLHVNQYHPGEIRRAVGFCSQEATIFYGSVRDNIGFGDAALDDQRIIAAAETAGVMDFVRNHPQGLDRPVGEGGRFLSAGQRQAIVLARALAHDYKILFLDEPTANLDRQSEAALVTRLAAAIRPEQTLIVATHRTAPLALVDRLIVLDGGRIVADGPKRDVLARFGPQPAATGARVHLAARAAHVGVTQRADIHQAS